MHFTKISAVLVGLTSFAAASPVAITGNSLAARGDAATPMERGLVWKPRSVEARNDRNDRDFDDRGRGRRERGRNNRIIIAQPINVQLNQITIVKQVQLVQIIKNLIVVDGGDFFRDNIRRNHFRNENRRRNRNVNTVVIVVTQVVDIRDVNRRNDRFLTRQVESNPEFQSKEFVVVTEQSTMTASETDGSSLPTGTGVSAAAETRAWDENSPLDISSQELLLPEGAAAPRWEGFASQSSDPASILEDQSGSFVAFA